MNQEIKARWLTALRSGEYEQGDGQLHYDEVGEEKPQFCCLGVLCDLAYRDGIITRHQQPANFTSRKTFYYGEDHDDTVLPDAVVVWAGIEFVNPFVDGVELATWNDGSSTMTLDIDPQPFSRIADLIEEYL